ncbi:MAG: hypothetical protein A3K03_06930 [Bdellovibrionales bacterium RIFOXYD1_FULL_44_7]|nr:MAG: hypothetical protein A3K03_06930 [Bdellovibrionales bacterium RIFOXYD1_FULL_44_7]
MDSNWARKLGLVAVVVTDILGYTGAGVALGWVLWDKVGLPWWILLLTSSAGLALGMYRLYKLSQKEL